VAPVQLTGGSYARSAASGLQQSSAAETYGKSDVPHRPKKSGPVAQKEKRCGFVAPHRLHHFLAVTL
jgi:hypothetical protein